MKIKADGRIECADGWSLFEPNDEGGRLVASNLSQKDARAIEELSDVAEALAEHLKDKSLNLYGEKTEPDSGADLRKAETAPGTLELPLPK